MKKIFLITLGVMFSSASFAQTSPLSSSAADEISQHYQALPNLYQWENVKKEQISAKIIRQYVMGSQSMIVKWTFQKGAIVPMHFHPNEQITWITAGSVKVISQGKTFIVKAGQVIIFPPYVPHEFHSLEDNTIDIDYFTPVREDWMNNSASYLK